MCFLLLWMRLSRALEFVPTTQWWMTQHMGHSSQWDKQNHQRCYRCNCETHKILIEKNYRKYICHCLLEEATYVPHCYITPNIWSSLKENFYQNINVGFADFSKEEGDSVLFFCLFGPILQLDFRYSMYI